MTMKSGYLTQTDGFGAWFFRQPIPGAARAYFFRRPRSSSLMRFQEIARTDTITGKFFLLIEFRRCLRGRIKLDSELNFQLTFAHSPAGYHSVDRVGPTKHESIACAWKGLFGSEDPKL